MRGIHRSLAAVGVVLCIGACAQISGLGGYSSAGALPESDGSIATNGMEAGPVDPGDEPRDGGPGDGGAGLTGDGQPAPAEVDAGGGDARDIDASGPSDASLVPDGYLCEPGTCGGCCSATGDCVGGQSVATCGIGGGTCNDCSRSGACVEGSCVTPPVDAGPPAACVATSCSTANCAGFPIQGACCKQDQTCGCQWTIFAPCL